MSDDFDYQSVSRPSVPIKCPKCEELRAALAAWVDMAYERGLGDPEETAFQLDGDSKEITKLKAALAEAKRERDVALDRLCTAPGEGDLVTAATDMTANYVEANRRSERADAHLAAAREVIKNLRRYAPRPQYHDSDYYLASEAARAFFERTDKQTGGEK